MIALPAADRDVLIRRLLEIALDALEPTLRAYVAIVHDDPEAEELRQRIVAMLDTLDAARARA